MDEPVLLEFGEREWGEGMVKKRNLLSVVAGSEIVDEVVGIKVECFKVFFVKLGDLNGVVIVVFWQTRCVRGCGVGGGWPGMAWWGWR